MFLSLKELGSLVVCVGNVGSSREYDDVANLRVALLFDGLSGNTFERLIVGESLRLLRLKANDP